MDSEGQVPRGPRYVLSSVGVLLVAVLAVASIGSFGSRSTGRRFATGLERVPAAARGAVSRTLGSDDARYSVARAPIGLTAHNPEQRLSGRFTAAGVRIGSGTGWLGLRLAGYGRGGLLAPVDPVLPHAHGNVVVYPRGSLQESYANGPLGLEQAFTLTAPPKPRLAGALTLSLSLSGNLRSSLARSSDAVSFTGSGVSLTYRGLIATDAGGRRLPASIGLAAGRLLLRVDDRGARYPVTVDPFVQQAELTASDAAAGDLLGTSVAVSGSTIVVGAYGRNTHAGAAYVFTKPAGGWADATQTAELTSSTHGAGGDEFGYSVAIDGSTIVVGAYNTFRTNSNPEAGTVYVYEKPPGGWTNATETAKLTASDEHTNGADWFGYSVAISGPTIAVGTGHTNFVYVFTKPGGGWVDATQTAELTANDLGPVDEFGQSVAVSGSTIVAGARQHNGLQGAVYEFTEPGGGWVDATQTAELTGSPTVSQLGGSVSVSGSTVAATGGGSVYVFTEPAGGWADGTQTAELTSSQHEFITSVAVSGPTIVAGAPTAGSAGLVYVFDESPFGWSNATETAELTSSDGAAGDHLGSSVALEGSTVVAGAPNRASSRGAAYVFAAPVAVANSDDQLTVQKAEQFIGLGPGETKSVTVSCPPGYEVLDGSPLVQQIDHGLPSFVEIVQSESTSPNSYTFTLRNPTSGNAQAKGFVTCIKSTTTDGGDITVSDPPVSQGVAFGSGTTTETLVCPPAQFGGGIAVDPGYGFTSGQGRVITSEPTLVLGLSAWRFTIEGSDPGNVVLSIRCLSPTTSDGDRIVSGELVRNVTVPAGQTLSASITCPVGGKGIVASYSLPDGVFLLGNEPQPITRVFSLENTTSSDQTATIDLLCLSNTTWRVAAPPTPPPSVHMTPHATVTRTSVSLAVACAAAHGCSGSIALRSGTSLIAGGRFAIAARRTAHVHLALTRTGKRLAQERRLHKLTATITTAGGHTTTASVTVSR